VIDLKTISIPADKSSVYTDEDFTVQFS